MPRQRTHSATGAPAIQKERPGSWWQTMEKKFRMARLRSGDVESSGAAMARAARASGRNGIAKRAAVPLRANKESASTQDPHPLSGFAEHFERFVQLRARVGGGHDGADAGFA